MDGPPEAAKEHIIFGVNDGDHIYLQPSRRGSLLATVRPMARKDIFYSGSILHLAGLCDPADRVGLDRYRHSVVSIPRSSSNLHNPLPRGSVVAGHLSIKRDVIDPEILSLKLDVSHSLRRVLKEMFDLSLLANPLLLLMCISNVFGFLALYVPYVYLPNMMVLKGKR